MASLLDESKDPRTRLYPMTVEQYHEMIERGIIEDGEPFELINGVIVRKDRSAKGEDPITIGLAHIYPVTALEELNATLTCGGPAAEPHGSLRL